VLAFSRLRLQVTVEGRETRQQVTTVDARDRARTAAARPAAPTGPADAREEPGGAGPVDAGTPGAVEAGSRPAGNAGGRLLADPDPGPRPPADG
jgi:hypothetical protein